MGRVRRVVQKMNQRITVQLAATLLAGSTLLSSALGLYRDRILNSKVHVILLELMHIQRLLLYLTLCSSY